MLNPGQLLQPSENLRVQQRPVGLGVLSFPGEGGSFLIARRHAGHPPIDRVCQQGSCMQASGMHQLACLRLRVPGRQYSHCVLGHVIYVL